MGDICAVNCYLCCSTGKSEAFEHALADFAVANADQNERDYDDLVAAVRAGRIEAQIVE